MLALLGTNLETQAGFTSQVSKDHSLSTFHVAAFGSCSAWVEEEVAAPRGIGSKFLLDAVQFILAQDLADLPERCSRIRRLHFGDSCCLQIWVDAEVLEVLPGFQELNFWCQILWSYSKSLWKNVA
eukprot:s1744_g7.t1